MRTVHGIFDRVRLELFDLSRDGLDALTSKVSRNIGVTLVAQVAGKAIYAVAFVLVIRNLQQSQLGVYSVVQSIVVVSSGFVLQGINWNLVQRISSRMQSQLGALPKSSLFAISLVAGLVGLLLLFLGLFDPSAIGLRPAVAKYALFFPLGIVAFGLSGYTKACFDGLQRFKEYAILSIGQNAVWLLSCLGLTILGRFDLEYLLLLLYLGYTLPFIYFIARRWRSLPRENVNLSSASFVMKQSSWYIGYGALLTLAGQVDILMMYHFFALREVGIYTVAVKLFSLLMLAVAALQSVMLPRLSSAAGYDDLRRLFWRMLRLSVPLALVVIGVFLFFAESLVDLVAGHRFLLAVLPFRILVLAVGESVLLSTHSQFLMVMGKNSVLMASGVIYLLTSMGLSALLIPRFGSLGAAGSVLFSLLITHIFVTSSVLRSLSGKWADMTYE